MLINKFECEVNADYGQFYLEDDDCVRFDGDIWTGQALERGLGVSEGAIAIARSYDSGTVPVEVEFYDRGPVLEDAEFDVINECSIVVRSSKLVLVGCPDPADENSPRFAAEPGVYRVRVNHGNYVNEDGEDFYVLQLWRETNYRDVVTVKPLDAENARSEVRM